MKKKYLHTLAGRLTPKQNINVFFKLAAHSLWLLAIFSSCENDVKKVNDWTKHVVMTEEATQVESFLSQDGKMKARLTAPIMLRVAADTLYMEFPKSLHVDFYDDSTKIETKLDCKYGKYLEAFNKVYLKDLSLIHIYYPANNETGNPVVMSKLMNSIRELHQLLKVNKDFKKGDEEMECYDVAHHLGLSLKEEYELLCLFDERQRQEYLKRHLAKVIPLLTGMEQLKEKIKLNGHFKNLSGFDLNV